MLWKNYKMSENRKIYPYIKYKRKWNFCCENR